MKRRFSIVQVRSFSDPLYKEGLDIPSELKDWPLYEFNKIYFVEIASQGEQDIQISYDSEYPFKWLCRYGLDKCNYDNCKYDHFLESKQLLALIEWAKVFIEMEYAEYTAEKNTKRKGVVNSTPIRTYPIKKHCSILSTIMNLNKDDTNLLLLDLCCRYPSQVKDSFNHMNKIE